MSLTTHGQSPSYSPQWKVPQLEVTGGDALETATSPDYHSVPPKKSSLSAFDLYCYYPIFMLQKQTTLSIQQIVWFLMLHTLKFFYNVILSLEKKIIPN